MFEVIRNRMQNSVPYAAHSGIVLQELDENGASAILPQTGFSVNHIASQHAGALFTLGETASGAAMAGLFASVMMSIRPVTSDASIRYTKVAKGTITAVASVAEDSIAVLDTFREQGKVSFNVGVTLTDESGVEVANMQVQWHVTDSRRRAQPA
ncbi:MAG: DUF4442 domain-containing protein [Sphingorhabdus sp.]|jgi:acyl-coenzyme A thioesterase PaaI-like protein|uniref:DUF4442 domain-containing protein n=1 Tax=Sphingorhabdus sp. TaxID=1902408 RepID=UPI0038FBF152